MMDGVVSSGAQPFTMTVADRRPYGNADWDAERRRAGGDLAGWALGRGCDESGDTLTTTLTMINGTITAGGQTGATVTLSGRAAINRRWRARRNRQQRLRWQRHADGDDDDGVVALARAVYDHGCGSAAMTETLTGTLSGGEQAANSVAGLSVADATNPSDS